MTFWICPTSALPNEWSLFRLIVILVFFLQLGILFFINSSLLQKKRIIIRGTKDVLKIRKPFFRVNVWIFIIQLILPLFIGFQVISELTADVVISMIFLSFCFSILVVVGYFILSKYQPILKRYK